MVIPIKDKNQWLATMFREAGKIELHHTLPKHGSYTTGQHAYDMLTLLFVIHPNPSINLIKAIVFYNLYCRWTGDIPLAAKRAGKEFTIHLMDLQTRIKNAIEIFDNDESLSKSDYNWLFVLDRVVDYLWARDQLALGNSNAASLAGASAAFFTHTEMPKEIENFLRNHQWFRLEDELPGER